LRGKLSQANVFATQVASPRVTDGNQHYTLYSRKKSQLPDFDFTSCLARLSWFLGYIPGKRSKRTPLYILYILVTTSIIVSAMDTKTSPNVPTITLTNIITAIKVIILLVAYFMNSTIRCTDTLGGSIRSPSLYVALYHI
jgi:hypothetical protein